MNNDQSPATKADLQYFMETIHSALADGEQNAQKRIEDSEKRMKKYIDKSEESTKHHFDVVAENIHHDMLKGALNDKVEQHEDRIQSLERHTGLVAA